MRLVDFYGFAGRAENTTDIKYAPEVWILHYGISVDASLRELKDKSLLKGFSTYQPWQCRDWVPMPGLTD